MQRSADAGEDLGYSVRNNGVAVLGAVDEYQDRTAINEAGALLSPKEIDVINNPDKYSPKRQQEVAEKYINTYAKIRGIDASKVALFDAKKLKNKQDSKGLDKSKMLGFSDGRRSSDKVYLNKDKIKRGNNFVKVLGHEAKRRDQIEKGLKNNTPDGISTQQDKAANQSSKVAQKAFKRELKYKGVKGKDNRAKSHRLTGADLTLIRRGTAGADSVSDAQPLMTVQLHEVRVGPIKTGAYHPSIRFKPENQAAYKDDQRFDQVDDTDGKRYVTLGAGPNLFNRLTGDINRDQDVNLENKVVESLSIVPVNQEDQVFEALINLDKNYNQNRLEYDIFPNPNKVKIGKVAKVGGILNRVGDSYNSGSYVSGILNAANIAVPELDQDFNMPGYNKPVPKQYFENHHE
eukprot:COSAG01_NODE_313_length_19043_cov_3.917177_8_plen_404_part_00